MDDCAALMHLYIVGDLIVCLIQKQWQGFVNVKKKCFCCHFDIGTTYGAHCNCVIDVNKISCPLKLVVFC